MQVEFDKKKKKEFRTDVGIRVHIFSASDITL